MIDAAYAADTRTMTLTRDYPHPIERVWAAISTPARIADWMGVEWLGDAAAALHEGAHFDYRFVGPDIESRAHVLRYEPPHVIEHSWFENEPPPATVRWALAPIDSGTRLTLTHHFPLPDDAPRTGAGWTDLMEQLAASLDGRTATIDSWPAARDHYAAIFGAEATRDGRLVQAGERQVLSFDRVLHHPPEKVWEALTTAEGIARWMQSRVEIDARIGGRIHYVFQDGTSTMTGEITAYDPPRTFAFTWPEPSAGGDSLVTFELAPDPAGCRLHLSHDVPASATAQGFAAGWHWHLDGLDAAAAGEATAWDAARFRMLRKIYGMIL